MKLSFTPSFHRSFKRLEKAQPEITSVFESAIKLFLQDPFHPSLHTHKLKGKLREFYSIKIAYDVRALFRFSSDGVAIFENIGSHDEMY